MWPRSRNSASNILFRQLLALGLLRDTIGSDLIDRCLNLISGGRQVDLVGSQKQQRLIHTLQTEHRMQLICDGAQAKRDVLQFSVDQYKDVFIKAKREFGTVVDVSSLFRHRHLTDEILSPSA